MKYVALLRGINVGGNRKVPMADLKSVFVDLGYADVITYINSGNVVFESEGAPDLQKLQYTLESTFGFFIPTVIRDYDQIKFVVESVDNDWKNNKEQKTDIMFLYPEFNRESVVGEIDYNPAVDKLEYLESAGALVWHFDRQYESDSKLDDFVGTRIWKNMTARNINTVRKIYSFMIR